MRRSDWTLTLGDVDYSRFLEVVRLDIVETFAIPARMLESATSRAKLAKVLPFKPRAGA